MHWWSCFRATDFKPYGHVVAHGPYESYEEALREIDELKRTVGLSVYPHPVSAKTREDATNKVEQLMP